MTDPSVEYLHLVNVSSLFSSLRFFVFFPSLGLPFTIDRMRDHTLGSLSERSAQSDDIIDLLLGQRLLNHDHIILPGVSGIGGRKGREW